MFKESPNKPNVENGVFARLRNSRVLFLQNVPNVEANVDLKGIFRRNVGKKYILRRAYKKWIN
jgi:hypothetical protein